MASKRPFPFEEDAGEGSLVPRPKKLRRFSSIVRLVVSKHTLQQLFVEMEPFLRRLIREAVRNALGQIKHPDPRQRVSLRHEVKYRLRFREGLPDCIYTGKKFSVPIVVLEANSSATVTSGPLSSIKIEVVVLKGHFCGDGEEGWTEEEFNQHVLKQREGKKPLLNGHRVIKLSCGAGTLEDMEFTDNSRWTRSGMFRLGARIFQSRSNEERVQEARSKAFTVKDNRVEPCQKHRPALWRDPVWRLEKIWKDGEYHKRLEANGIKTVEDFIRRLKEDEVGLRSKLGRMSKKGWEITVECARESVRGDKLYSYRNAMKGVEEVELMFDSNLQLVGAKFGDRYHPLSGLDESQMVKVKDLVKCASENRNAIVLVRHATSCEFSGPLPTANATLIIGSSSHQPQNTIPPPTNHGKAAIIEGSKHEHSARHFQAGADTFQLNDLSAQDLFIDGANRHDGFQHQQVTPDIQRLDNFSQLSHIGQDNHLANPSALQTEGLSSIICQATTSWSNVLNVTDVDTMILEYLQLEQDPWNGNGYLAPGLYDTDVTTMSTEDLAKEEDPMKKPKWVQLITLFKFKMLIRRKLTAKRARNVHGYPKARVIFTH